MVWYKRALTAPSTTAQTQAERTASKAREALAAHRKVEEQAKMSAANLRQKRDELIDQRKQLWHEETRIAHLAL